MPLFERTEHVFEDEALLSGEKAVVEIVNHDKSEYSSSDCFIILSIIQARVVIGVIQGTIEAIDD